MLEPIEVSLEVVFFLEVFGVEIVYRIRVVKLTKLELGLLRGSESCCGKNTNPPILICSLQIMGTISIKKLAKHLLGFLFN